MKIYDFETFKENCKNIKVIKLKKWKDITNKEPYCMSYEFWGKPLTVRFSEKNFIFFYFVNEKGNHAFRISKKKFEDVVEYVEINSGLEIE